jgi:hypothetical protein
MKNLIVALIAMVLSTTIAVAQTCLDAERVLGNVVGQADFIGEPWDGTRYGVDVVPGTGLRAIFEDGSEFVYGSWDRQDSLMADNLSSLQKYWSDYPTPYHVIRRTDGTIVVLPTRGSCEGWVIQHPLP